MIKYFLATLLVAVLSACANLQATSQHLADKVLLNANIYTVNQAQPWAQAVAIAKGKIVYVGDDVGAQRWIGSKTLAQDLQGKFLLPGFVDAHSHIFLGGAHMDDLVLNPKADIATWLQEVKDYSQANPSKKIIIGSGFLSSTFGADGPNKAMLDAVVPDRPVFIMDEGMHGAWLNSAALTVLKITAETPDLSNFDYYKRDSRGEPTGYILEGTVWQAMSALNANTVQSVAEGTAKVIDLYNSYGVTAVFDAGPWDAKDIQLDVLEELESQDALTIRFQGSQYIDNIDDKDTIVDELLRLQSKSQGTRHPINVLKIMVDGTVEGQTAAMFNAYQNDADNFGESVFTPAQLNSLVDEASSKNIDVHFHALGDRAISESLDAIALAKNNHPDSSARFTISHIQVMADKDIPRFAQLGVIAQSSLLWAAGDEQGEKFLSADQFQRYYRFNSLLNAGVTLSFGCDFSSHGGGLEGIAPLYNMEVGHTRQLVGSPSSMMQPLAKEKLSIASLIYGYTMGGAYQMRLEHEIGSIEVGKRADMVLLDENLFMVKPYRIHKVQVLKTWLDGELVFSKL
ncbi:amidohydrolase [Dasania sp. GY-MA-18]|uniref:Amidohydrolase n=1 Tax=Dasania phycosphaerae TaxID=2950436 RepID=A0A9J6RQN3_9GAMM|nr:MULTISPECIES: amidohydrolase [Dasania]MCR8923923.1 amidohydrolase [Dasania sp. GY-MA-18]MCZ0866357.1 amidohydrolase [Dasania phycosphaerae]MCZ0870081.1 amidohydrolase [Dasania phycosphaerae]